MERWTPMAGLGLWLAVWVASSGCLNLLERLRQHPAPRWRTRLAAQPGSYWGMLLAHGGVAVFILGVTVVNSFQSENDVRMEPGESASVGGYQFRLQAIQRVAGPNYTAARAVMEVTHDGQAVATLMPERRIYTVSRMPMTEVAIDRGLGRDLYVALGEPVSSTAWSVRLHHKPLVNWIWGGCLLMALGGSLAVLDRRYRARRVPASTPVAAATPVPVATAETPRPAGLSPGSVAP